LNAPHDTYILFYASRPEKTEAWIDPQPMRHGSGVRATVYDRLIGGSTAMEPSTALLEGNNAKRTGQYAGYSRVIHD
jgi:hypothetical protein